MIVLLCLPLNPRVALGQSIGDNSAYVTNAGSDTVSVIDTSTNAVVATIPLGDAPQRVAFNQDGSKAYVTNSGDNTVSVIDTVLQIVTATIPVGTSPSGLDLSPDGSKMYVATNGAVYMIDTVTDTVSGSFAVTAGATNLKFTPDGTEVWVDSGCVNCVQTFAYPSNTSTGIITGIIGNAERMDFLPDGSAAFVSNACGGCGNLQKIDAVSKIVVNSFSYGGTGNGIAVAPDGSSVFAGNQGGGNNVRRFNPATLGVTGAVTTGGPPEGLAITSDGSTLYAAEVTSPGHVAVIDTASMTITTSILVGVAPVDVAFVPSAAPPVRQLTALSPTKVWVGLKNSDAVGIKFDLLAEVYKDSTLVSTGQINRVPGGSSGFNNAKLNTIPFNPFTPVNFPQGSQLKIQLYVRNTCTGPTHNSGTARLWFNDSAANSRFDATIDSTTNDYFLRDGFLLATTAGPGPKKTIDVAAGAPCSPFKTFGTWTITL